MGDWFWDTPPMIKSADAQVPYIKWLRTVHRVGLPHPWMKNLGIWRASCIFIEKQFLYKWTRAVQTCVVQESTEFCVTHTPLFLHKGWNIIKMLLHPVFFEGASLPSEKIHMESLTWSCVQVSQEHRMPNGPPSP